ncbi:efflux RND transporter periplasmic adaptor subunit [Tautonia rosea]|uniref:efflux RND transporter periplasmic adaptor subunit n=1 Tax=Tautonia rosea TaxID=2728037 RepID=UPI0014745F6B|nr:HlyD family efflux transporter periplasmic adaptor subunit [Tautonia rosea]
MQPVFEGSKQRLRMWITEARSAATPESLRDLLRRNGGLVALGMITVALSTALLILAIMPRYQDPAARLYTSKLGYAGIARKLGKPFPVSAATVQHLPLTTTYQGEGMTRSEPIQVPLIPLGTIQKIHADLGDPVTKGQVLVEIDPRRAQVKINAAQAAITIALGELERTELGSSYILAQERPALERIRHKYAELRAQVNNEIMAMNVELLRRNASNRKNLLLDSLSQLEAMADLELENVSLGMAEAGAEASVRIAKAKIEEAKLALQHRELELEDYTVRSPADGVVERLLVHEGEYNQDPGKPAMLLASGVWFEARMDQTSIGRFSPGTPAAVHLESYPGQPIPGTVTKILPVVTYDLGGPEATRPIRPLGTGAPEWPSTFGVQITLHTEELLIVPGLTGFARIESTHAGPSIPNAALVARSGRTAFVYVADGDQRKTKEVVIGASAGGYTEIQAGLEPGQIVLIDGYQILETGDSVQIETLDGEPLDPPRVLSDAAPSEPKLP